MLAAIKFLSFIFFIVPLPSNLYRSCSVILLLSSSSSKRHIDSLYLLTFKTPPSLRAPRHLALSSAPGTRPSPRPPLPLSAKSITPLPCASSPSPSRLPSPPCAWLLWLPLPLPPTDAVPGVIEYVPESMQGQRGRCINRLLSGIALSLFRVYCSWCFFQLGNIL